MTTEDIITLLNAGYTKDEILALDAGAGTQPEEPAPAGDSAAAGSSDPAPADGNAGSEEQPDALQEVLTQLAAVKVSLKALQASNAAKADSGAPAKRMTADDVVRDFFAAPAK